MVMVMMDDDDDADDNDDDDDKLGEIKSLTIQGGAEKTGLVTFGFGI